MTARVEGNGQGECRKIKDRYASEERNNAAKTPKQEQGCKAKRVQVQIRREMS